jgi:hypothetical protein
LLVDLGIDHVEVAKRRLIDNGLLTLSTTVTAGSDLIEILADPVTPPPAKNQNTSPLAFSNLR